MQAAPTARPPGWCRAFRRLSRRRQSREDTISASPIGRKLLFRRMPREQRCPSCWRRQIHVRVRSRNPVLRIAPSAPRVRIESDVLSDQPPASSDFYGHNCFKPKKLPADRLLLGLRLGFVFHGRQRARLRIGSLKRFTPQHSLDKHRGDAGEGCLAKRAAQKGACPSRLSTSARSTQ